MTPRDLDEHEEPESEHELYDDSPPRSIFAATWFRAILILIVLGVVGAVAVPYVLDAINPPTPKTSVIARPVPPLPANKPTDTDKSVPPAATSGLSSVAAPQAKSNEPSPSATKPATAPESPIEKLQAAPKTAPSTDQESAKPTPSRAVTRATPSESANATWWVQVGAFKDQASAKRLAAKLRGDSYTVEEVAFIPPTGGTLQSPAKVSRSAAMDQYDVFVSGLTIDELNKRLTAQGLASRPAGTGVVVTPSLPLRDAVALSKTLAADGLKVQVKRVRGSTPEAKSGARSPSAGALTLYRVRVGGFTDRAGAQAVAKELEGKGYKPFIGRG